MPALFLFLMAAKRRHFLVEILFVVNMDAPGLEHICFVVAPARISSNTQISLLLLCFLCLFVELPITMNEHNFV